MSYPDKTTTVINYTEFRNNIKGFLIKAEMFEEILVTRPLANSVMIVNSDYLRFRLWHSQKSVLLTPLKSSELRENLKTYFDLVEDKITIFVNNYNVVIVNTQLYSDLTDKILNPKGFLKEHTSLRENKQSKKDTLWFREQTPDVKETMMFIAPPGRGGLDRKLEQAKSNDEYHQIIKGRIDAFNQHINLINKYDEGFDLIDDKEVKNYYGSLGLPSTMRKPKNE